MSDKTKNDLHKTGCRRYRDINKQASRGTAAGADLNFCTPRVQKLGSQFDRCAWLVAR
jgi:hypothetical protein